MNENESQRHRTNKYYICILGWSKHNNNQRMKWGNMLLRKSVCLVFGISTICGTAWMFENVLKRALSCSCGHLIDSDYSEFRLWEKITIIYLSLYLSKRTLGSTANQQIQTELMKHRLLEHLENWKIHFSLYLLVL